MNIFSFLIFGLFSLIVAESPIDLDEQIQGYPHIITQTSKCRPIEGNYKSLITYVCDPDKLLDVNQINSLNDMIESVRKDINVGEPDCSAENPKPTIAIALVKKMIIPENSKVEELMSFGSLFSYSLFTNWNLQVNCKSDPDKIIIFYSKDDSVLYIFVGKKLKARLDTNKLMEIINDSKPAFTNGLYQGLTAVIARLKDTMIRRSN